MRSQLRDPERRCGDPSFVLRLAASVFDHAQKKCSCSKQTAAQKVSGVCMCVCEACRQALRA